MLFKMAHSSKLISPFNTAHKTIELYQVMLEKSPIFLLTGYRLKKITCTRFINFTVKLKQKWRKVFKELIGPKKLNYWVRRCGKATCVQQETSNRLPNLRMGSARLDCQIRQNSPLLAVGIDHVCEHSVQRQIKHKSLFWIWKFEFEIWIW